MTSCARAMLLGWLLAGIAHGPLQAGTPMRSGPPGGAATVQVAGRNAFLHAAPTLDDADRTRFAVGNSFFRRNWVEAPSSTTARDGLGPHFSARSCSGCHVNNGRGAPPDDGKKAGEAMPLGLVLTLSIPGSDEHGMPLPDPVYGSQLSEAAVQGVKPEGRVAWTVETVSQFSSGGRAVRLQRARYRVDEPGYGPLHAQSVLSPRLATQLIGLGLIEAIPEAEILRNAARQAARRDGVHGQPQWVWDDVSERKLLGRFGWKAGSATLAHQAALAFSNDIGITSSRFPDENCTPSQHDCLAAPRGTAAAGLAGRAVDIDDATLDDVVFYLSAIGPPARRNEDTAAVRRGELLFHEAGCAVCHRPSYVTGPRQWPRTRSAAVEGHTIWPYTDLLLHDLGEGLADGRPEAEASARQWRTPPLWGLGLAGVVNGHGRLLHDGRARGVLEAVFWHDGEGLPARERVRAWTAAEQDALVRFVESL